ncbi:AMP-binding protein [Enterovibrio sp. FF113]|uniref:AMP-binding protein n=1 Tax=Enterovibrio sp. FF113 TaxID=3230010 RepID=UPI00352E94B9
MDFKPLSLLLSRPTDDDLFLVADGEIGFKTQRDFQHDVATLYHVLNTHPAARWAVCFDDSYYMAVAVLALSYAGKTVVIPGNIQIGALNELAHEFDAMLSDRHASVLPNNDAITLPIDHKSHHAIALDALSLDSIKIVLYTSGSSGKPKAIEKSLQQLQAEIDILEQTWGSELATSSIVSTVSHQHIYGLLFRVLWPLCARRTFSRTNAVYPQQHSTEQALSQTLISSPAQLKRLKQDHPRLCFCAVFSSGGPLPFNAAEKTEQYLGKRPFEVFGSTETGGIAHRQQHTDTATWTLFDGISATLTEQGCLRLRSPFIHPKVDYDTSDLCDFHNDGTFTLQGRADRIVKIEEKRVSLAEVENRLMDHTWIEDTVCIAKESADRQYIAAALVLSQEGKCAFQNQGDAICRQTLRQHLAQWLDAISIPREYTIASHIPQNSQGKREANAVDELFTPSSKKKTTDRPPSVVKTAISNLHAELSLCVDSDLREFEGHFPGFAIYPGVSQINAVVHFALDIFGITAPFRSLDKLKFEAPIWPDMQVQLSMNWKPEKNALTFRLESTAGLHTRGVIHFD